MEQWKWLFWQHDFEQRGVCLLNPIPTTTDGWNTAPYEVQYLKLYDVSAPNTASPSPQITNTYSYALGNNVTFTWSADPNVNPTYMVTLTVNGVAQAPFSVTGTSYTYTGNFGDQVSIVVTATNPDFPVSSSGAGPVVTLLDPNGDADGDWNDKFPGGCRRHEPVECKLGLPDHCGRVHLGDLELRSRETIPGGSCLFPGGSYSAVGPVVTATASSTSETIALGAGSFYHVKLVLQ